MKYLSYEGLAHLKLLIKNALDGKVDKVSGKGLSTNDYTTTEKNKLSGIEAGANKTTVDTVLNTASTNPVQNKVIAEALDDKVDKEDGKGLSSNDLTDDLVTKWNNTSTKVEEIATVGGEPNVIEVIKRNGTVLGVSDKTVNIVVPTKTSELTNNSNFTTLAIVESQGYLKSFEEEDPIFAASPSAGITAADITKWNGKSEFSGYYSDLIGTPTLPTKVSELTNDVPYIKTNSTSTQKIENIYYDNNQKRVKAVGAAESVLANYSDIPTNNNQLTNGAGYQTASEVTALIGEAIKDITGISYQIVASLPSTGSPGVIYLVSNGGSNPNIYDEYIYANGKFEKIGTTDVDLSGYVQDTDLVAITNSEIDTIWES